MPLARAALDNAGCTSFAAGNMGQDGQGAVSCEKVGGPEEAAVLFAAGHGAAAMAQLQAVVEAGEADRRTWLVLLDLCHAMQRREDFDRLLAAFESRFGKDSHAGWGYPPAIEASGAHSLGGVMTSTTDLGALSRHVAPRSAAAFDMGQVERIELDFAPALHALLRTWHAAGKRVILANISELNASLLEVFGADRYAVLMRAHRAPHLQRLAA